MVMAETPPASLATWRAKWGASIPTAVGRAVDLCARNRDPEGPPPASTRPPGAGVVAEMLGFLGFDGFNGLAYLEGRFLSGKLGETWPGPTSPSGTTATTGGAGPPFDFEGVAKRGWCSSTAAWPERSSTTPPPLRRRDAQHGPPCRPPNTYGPIPLNLIMANGEAPDREAMLGGSSAGCGSPLLVHQSAAPPTVTITGMTRDGTFLVQDGQVVGALKNLRFTQDRGGPAGRACPEPEGLLQPNWIGSAVVPALHLGRFSFTGPPRSGARQRAGPAPGTR